jgi:nifR3 family TIM-barrel protein
MLNEPFLLGNLQVPNRVLLSPLAGVSDAPFRRICQELGAGLSYIEMLSAAGMPHENRKSGELIYRDPAEPILGAQMTGATPEVMSTGMKILMEKRLPVDTVDINMGCPVKKVVSRGCGSAVVKDPVNAGNIVRAVRDAVDVPVTTKIRIGFTRKDLTVRPVCQELAKAGTEMLIIHGRVREDSYSDPVQYDQIKAGFDAAREAADGRRIWMIGNGNIFDVESARRMVEETQCDGVLISRGCLGNPWIFRQILEDSMRQPTVSEWLELVLRHAKYHEEFYQEGHYAAIRFRKHLLWYVSGFPGSRPLRSEISSLNLMSDVRERLEAYASTLPPDLPRYEDPKHFISDTYDPKFEMDRAHDRGVEHYEES